MTSNTEVTPKKVNLNWISEVSLVGSIATCHIVKTVDKSHVPKSVRDMLKAMEV